MQGHVKTVLHDHEVDAEHISDHPCEDVDVCMEELDQLCSGHLTLLTFYIHYLGSVGRI